MELQIAECRMQIEDQRPPPRAIDLARALYAKHGGSLEKELKEYHWPNGVIVDLPDCFAIAYITETETGELAWFVKVATGDLPQLLLLFPVTLPFVGFHREKTGKLKYYRTDLLLRMAEKLSLSSRRT